MAVQVSLCSNRRLAVSEIAYLEREMSGRRAKALRKAFYQLHHRAPEKTETKQVGVFGWVKSKIKKEDDHKDAIEKKSRAIMAMLVTDSYSEWRRFKRAWTAR